MAFFMTIASLMLEPSKGTNCSSPVFWVFFGSVVLAYGSLALMLSGLASLIISLFRR